MPKELGACAAPDNDFDDFDLAVGTPLELWLGVAGETRQEQAAREAAAREILADDPGLYGRVTRLAAGTLLAAAPEMLTVLPLHRGGPVPVRGQAVAA